MSNETYLHSGITARAECTALWHVEHIDWCASDRNKPGF